MTTWNWAGVAGVWILCITCVGTPQTRGGVTAGGDTTLAPGPSQDSYIGNISPGTLNISEGSAFVNSTAYVGNAAGAFGAVTVSGTGSTWSSAGLYLGYDGSGSVLIESGGQLNNASPAGAIYMAFRAGSTGTATVRGSGSKWTDSSSLYVGIRGNAALNIESGGQVSNTMGSIASATGSSGAVLVTGAGSSWTNSSILFVGREGTGSLTVSDGGAVTAKSIFTSLGSLHGNGSITVNGAVLDENLVFDAQHSLSQTLDFGSGGQLKLNSTAAGYLGAGHKGTGSLTVADGMSVASTYGYLGYVAGSSGSGVVTGAGSAWSNSAALYVGYEGNGRLTVSDGGTVSAKTLYASMADLVGNGTISANGVVLDGELTFDAAHGATQSVSFGSGGTLNLIVNGTGEMGLGYKGNGAMRVADGVVVASTTGYLGFNAGSVGTAVVSGPGSKWTNSGTLNVGYRGNGNLTIENGGQVSGQHGELGELPGSSGTARINGAGSIWTNSSFLSVGTTGTGSLLIESGGQAVCATGTIGSSSSGAGGEATITGSGSTWTCSTALYVSGTLMIDAGAVANSKQGIVGNSAGSIGTATISGVGSRWSSDYTLVAGSGMGTVNIHSAGQMSTGVNGGKLGSAPGVVGTVNIADLGSAWSNSATLTVGDQGAGFVNVERGAQLSSASAYLGYYSTGVGSVRIKGPGSNWVNSGPLYVGYGGGGSIAILEGGTVSTGMLYASMSDLSGDGTIVVNGGGIFDADLAFDSQHATTGTAPFGSGGTLSVTPTASSDFGVGYRSTGSVSIADGVSLSSAKIYLGYISGSAGTAILSGAGSNWSGTEYLVGEKGAGTLRILSGAQASSTFASIGRGSAATGLAVVDGTGSRWDVGNLYVGYVGRGILSAGGGAQVINDHASVGRMSGSSGEVTVAGAGTTWTVSGSLHVGEDGRGALTVRDGGRVTVNSLWASLSDLSGNGVIAAEGGVLDADLVYDASSGSVATLPFGSGGTLTVSITGNTDYMGAGYKGNGTLQIRGGRSLSTYWGYLGRKPGSFGTATVSGANSKWALNSLYIGMGGSGRLIVSEGGSVSASSLYASLTDILGNGAVTVNGSAVLDGNLVFDSTHGTTQTIGFGSGGTLSLTVKSTGTLGSGYRGNGSLKIAEGITVTSASGYLGRDAGSNGVTTVTGTGSKWSAGTLFVGYAGNGELRLSNGGQTSSSNGYLGYLKDGIGRSTLAGGGSKWTNSAGIFVGYSGTGILRVQPDAQIATLDLTAGFDFGSTGSVFVTGAGSRITVSGNSFVGNRGTGSLLIAEAGFVSSSFTSYIGYSAGSAGLALVTGAASQWTNSSSLMVGSSGRGILRVGDQGKVTARSLSINSQSKLQLEVSGNDMIVLGSASSTGSLSNSGIIAMYCDAMLTPGVYRPIAEFAGRSMTVGGMLTAIGGAWNSTSRTLTVSPATELKVGETDLVTAGERFLIVDPGGARAGASFGAVSGAISFSASPMSASLVDPLFALLQPDQSVAAAWDFSTNFSSSGEVLLSMDVGAGISAEDVTVWHLANGVWSQYTPSMLTIDANGLASFTVTSFSGYAVAVPEPSAAAILGTVSALVLMRRRRAILRQSST